MSKETELVFTPRLVDPGWMLPGEIDAFRRDGSAMFKSTVNAVKAAFERIDEIGGDRAQDAAEFQVIRRTARQALRYYAPPFPDESKRELHRKMLLELIKLGCDHAAQRMHSCRENDFDVIAKCEDLREADALVEMICLLIAGSDLLEHPNEALVKELVDLYWSALAISGDGELRERAGDVPSSLRLANLDLNEAAEPIARRLGALLKQINDNRVGKPAERVAAV